MKGFMRCKRLRVSKVWFGGRRAAAAVRRDVKVSRHGSRGRRHTLRQNPRVSRKQRARTQATHDTNDSRDHLYITRQLFDYSM